MIPLRLTATNVRSYAELDVRFGDGVLALVGPNGAGKSTIIDLIDTALFADGARELAPMLRLGETELMIAFDFEHVGVEYHIARSYSATGRGKVRMDLLALELDGPIRAPLNQETVAATQASLEEILGFTRQTFRASSFCRQGDARAFCDAQPRERKQLLADILRLDLWDRLLAVARADQAENTIAGAKLAARAEAAEAILADRGVRATLFARARDEAEIANIERGIAELELTDYREALAEARTRYQERRAVEAELARLDAEVKRVTELVETAEKAREDKTRLAAELAELEPQEQTLPTLEQALRDGREAQSRFVVAETERRGLLVAIETGMARATEQREKAETLDARPLGTDRCDRCQQLLGVEGRAAAVASLRREADEATEETQRRQERLETLVVPPPPFADELEQLEHEIARAQMTARRAEAVRVLLKAAEAAEHSLVDGSRAKLDEVRARQSSKVSELEALPPVEKPEGDEGTLIMRVGQLRDREHAALGVLELARDKLNAVDLAEAQLAEITEELVTSRTHAAMLDLAEQAYGRNGVPALIVESRAIPELEAQANDVLERWAAPYRVELRTQKELKGGGVAEALDIVCLDGGAFERPFEGFSGGEKTRIALALRIGLARLLARRRGANSRLLVIDEPEGLDAEGMARLPALLEALQSEYGVILVVSHQPQLATAFPRVLRVSKDGGVSWIDGGAEAVAA